MPWEQYRNIVTREFSALLSDSSNGEPELQKFMEMHPCLIPGHDAFYASAEPGPIYATAFSQPVLPGIYKRIPDFMWLPTDSQTQWAVLIELEGPNKRWFTQDGEQRAELTQAVDQVLEWKAQLSEPVNRLQFMDLYSIGRPPLAFEFCLIYGRREEVQISEPRQGFRLALQHPDVKWMTYDRLQPAEQARDYLCSKIVDTRNFEALSAPATLRINPTLASMWRSIRNKPAAVRNSPHFSDERREFLIARFKYWGRLPPCAPTFAVWAGGRMKCPAVGLSADAC